ncbi:MAG TPA: YdeI/OmpD-associated family protein [Chitinophagaceae bacterium]
MTPIFFATQRDLRKWFEKNHDKEKELWLGFYKTSSGKPSVTWSESVDQALSFGWIDGVRKSLGKDSYVIRFTQRKPKSIWSAINIKKVEELTKLGLMHPAGIDAFNKRDEKKSRVYSFEQKNVQLDKNFAKQFRENKQAWKFFQSQPPSYQRPAIWWVISAKQEITKQKRLNTLIKDSEAGQRIAQLRPYPRTK